MVHNNNNNTINNANSDNSNDNNNDIFYPRTRNRGIYNKYISQQYYRQ